ncbi:MAG: hypothetical protein FWG67_10380 [Defluviitaleaceae bacterium]|nr:hypothetical protein [Defluviitaleaceae bacterium]
MSKKKANLTLDPTTHHLDPQPEEPWLGNPDDHEPTTKVTKETINP